MNILVIIVLQVSIFEWDKLYFYLTFKPIVMYLQLVSVIWLYITPKNLILMCLIYQK